MVTFIILLNVQNNKITEIAEHLADMPEISEVYSVTGNYDLVVIVRTRPSAHSIRQATASSATLCHIW